MIEDFNALDAAMQLGTSNAVKMWINWMGIIFLSSLFFVWKRKPARYVLLAMLLTLPLGFLVWKLSNSIHLIGIAHLILWLPLLIYLYKVEYSKSTSSAARPDRLKSSYYIWLSLLILTIVISLIFDVRDIALVLMGQK